MVCLSGRGDKDMAPRSNSGCDQRRPSIIAGEESAMGVRDLRYGREVGQFQRRVGRRLDPDEFRVAADALFSIASRSVISTKSTASCQRAKSSRKSAARRGRPRRGAIT